MENWFLMFFFFSRFPRCVTPLHRHVPRPARWCTRTTVSFLFSCQSSFACPPLKEGSNNSFPGAKRTAPARPRDQPPSLPRSPSPLGSMSSLHDVLKVGRAHLLKIVSLINRFLFASRSPTCSRNRGRVWPATTPVRCPLRRPRRTIGSAPATTHSGKRNAHSDCEQRPKTIRPHQALTDNVQF